MFGVYISHQTRDGRHVDLRVGRAWWDEGGELRVGLVLLPAEAPPLHFVLRPV